MEPFRLTSGGPIFETLAGVLFASVPGAVVVIAMSREPSSGIWMILLLLAVYSTIYLQSVSRCGLRLEERRAAIRACLA
jgi:hypothetical protein